MRVLQLLKTNKKYVYNSFWSNLRQITASGFSVLSAVIFTRFTSEEAYGSYLLTLSVLSLFYIFTVPGFQSTILRCVSQGFEGVYAKSVAVRVKYSFFAIPFIILTGAYYYFYKNPAVGSAIMLASLFFPFYFSFNSWVAYLKAKENFRQYFYYYLIQSSLITLATMLALFLSSQNLIIIIVSLIIVSSLADYTFHRIISSQIKTQSVDENWKKQGFSLSFLRLSTDAFHQIDKVIISLVMPISQVAVYALIMKFVDVLFATITSTFEAIIPKIHSSNSVKIKYFYSGFFISFLIPLIIFPFVKPLVILFFTEKYAAVVNYIHVYLLAVPFFFFSRTTTTFFIKHNRNKEINISKIVSSLITVTLYIILIPIYGLIGGVIASIIFFVSQSIFNLYYLKRDNITG